MSKSIIILDDHPLFQAGLKLVLDPEPLLKVTDTCRTSEELFFALSIGPADILLLDCSRPDVDIHILDLVKRLHQQQPDSALVLMGENALHQLIAEQCSAMIEGYLCKTLPAENMLIVLHRIRRKLNSDTCEVRGKKIVMGLKKPVALMPLSAKERTVIEYLHKGLSVTQTAERVNRSVKTVSTQKRQAMRKLGIRCERDIYELNLNEL